MEQDGVSAEFKRKVAQWEAAGVFDRIAAKVDEVLDKEKDVGMRSRGPPGDERLRRGRGIRTT